MIPDHLEDCFMIFCRGDPLCESVWLIPISELKGVLREANTKTFKELADQFVCDECQELFEHLTTSAITLNDESQPN